jgi:hypothetical protein
MNNIQITKNYLHKPKIETENKKKKEKKKKKKKKKPYLNLGIRSRHIKHTVAQIRVSGVIGYHNRQGRRGGGACDGGPLVRGDIQGVEIERSGGRNENNN